MLLNLVRADNTDKILELLQTPQDLNVIDPKTGNSLLHFAVKNQNVVVLREILACKTAIVPANPNILNPKEGFPPLVSALNLNFTEGITLLLQHKADPQFRFNDGGSLLNFAVAQNTPQIIGQLIKFGAKVNVVTSQGSALHVAVNNGQVENALFLLERPDISLDGVDQDGDSIFHVCSNEGAAEVLNAIIQKVKANKAQFQNQLHLVNQLNFEGNSPLHIAAINERTLILKLFVQNADVLEVNLELPNKAGQTYEKIQQQLEQQKQAEKELIVQRKKEAQEEKNKRNQQKRQDIVEQHQREEKEKIIEKERKIAAKVQADKITSKTKWIFAVILVLLLVGFYLSFDIAIKNKKRNILE